MHLPVAQIPLQARPRPVVAERGGDRPLPARRHARMGERLARPPSRRWRGKDAGGGRRTRRGEGPEGGARGGSQRRGRREDGGAARGGGGQARGRQDRKSVVEGKGGAVR